MSEWKEIKLKDICHIIGGGTPSKRNPEYWDGYIPWVTPTDVTKNKLRELEFTSSYITQVGLAESSAKLIPPGSILMTTRATIGECVINKVTMATNQGFTNFICKEKVFNKYLYYTLIAHKPQFDKLGSGSTFKEVSKQIIKSYPVLLPPLPEQRKIAAILSSVDEAIEKTEAIITQTETVKKGLMQKLLTRGIGHTRFKKTEIGEIPEEWEIKNIQQVSSFVSRGKGPKYVEHSSFKVINQKCIQWNSIELNEAKYVDEQTKATWKEELFVKKNDVLLNSTGTGTIGRTNIMNSTSGDLVVDSHVTIVRTREEILNPHFLKYYLETQRTQQRLEVLCYTGSTNQIELSKTQLLQFPIPIPSLYEQSRIAEVLSSVEAKIQEEEQHLTQLQTLKKGLMQVLLTGKVRVKVDEPEEVAVP
ncbi:restriction endonuclease subunit S [Paludifilum halophilum]|uniref:restriction endonuclease subunit S n=1 Tax=Paludifilum halophilum TaxID=1642702 RepID=UPI00146ECAFB|nr:restriction endonuclease subunit S [Paludifilum halophilum]